MFYSHHLLARKAPLGQIWMAATLHAKINRRKLDKLDIIKICEQILNPTVPMALRLSGILMGGVVIVYERKVKLLYDDVTRFLIEINEAWKVKPTVDPTVLPKGKAQAKFEAVTLPKIVEMETEQTMHFSDASFTTTRLQRMRLDDLDEQFINISIRDEDLTQQHHHQAEAANITLFDDFGSCLGETDLYNRFERFDIEEDEEIHINFTPQEQPTLVPSESREDIQLKPPMSRVDSPPNEQPQADKQPVDEEENPQPEPHKHTSEEPESNEQKPQPSRKRKERRPRPRVIMDNEQIMILGTIYQLWLQDASSIVSKRGRRTKSLNPILNTKIGNLMDMPPVALINGLQNFSGEISYPAPLLELWRKCTQAIPAHSSSSGGISPDGQTTPSHSPPEGLCHHNMIPDFPPGDFQSEAGFQPMASSVEKFMPEQRNMNPQSMFNDAVPDNQFDFPLSPAGQSSKSAPSSGSGHTLFPSPEEIMLTATRDKKRHHSSAISKLGNLAPVEEEGLLEQDVRTFKIPRHGPIPDSDLLEETGPTQTPHPAFSDPSVDKVTQSIREHLKVHFDTPGAPQSETIEQLSIAMNRKGAAKFFYQTCVLATLDFVKVHQAEPYGDILICRGPKM